MKKSRFGKAKHQKLAEDWKDSKQLVEEGLTFQIKYLGSCFVDHPNGEKYTAEAIKKVVSQAKPQDKLRKVALNVTPNGILQQDIETEEQLEEISIDRISYCTADKNFDKVFGFIVRNHRNQTLECHAYLCAKRKQAEALTLSVAQAFNIAYENLQACQQESGHTLAPPETIMESKKPEPEQLSELDALNTTLALPSSIQPPPRHPRVGSVQNRTANLIDTTVIDNGDTNQEPVAAKTLDKPAVQEEDLEDCFSKLAESRSSVQPVAPAAAAAAQVNNSSSHRSSSQGRANGTASSAAASLQVY